MSGSSNPPQRRLALLIDGDNAQPCVIKGVMAEVAKCGIADVRRIYGDWTTPQSGRWKTVLIEHSIQPVQQFHYTSGKNATDCAMIIEAMDLLYTRRFDGFCLVSSDSDFSRLAVRLREDGLLVLGFGEAKTPTAFRSACSRFIFTEALRDGVKEETASGGSPTAIAATAAVCAASANELKGDTKLVNLLRSAVEAASDNEGWSRLSSVGSNIVNTAPGFKPGNYGFARLGDLLEAITLFEVERRANGTNNGTSSIHVRMRRKSAKSAQKKD